MKKVLIGMGIFLCILVALALVLPYFIDLTAYQAQYQPVIERALNRKVTLTSLRLTIIPRIGVRMKGFTIQDDPAFSNEPFAAFRSLDVKLKLLPLLHKHVEVEKILLIDPVFTLVKNIQGQLNTSTLGKHGDGHSEIFPGETQALSVTDVDPPTAWLARVLSTGQPVMLASAEGEGQLPATAPSGTEPQALPEGVVQALGLVGLEEVIVKNGTVTFHDQNEPKPSDFVLQHLAMTITNVVLGKLPHLHVETNLMPLNIPIFIDGVVGPIQETLDVATINLAFALGQIKLVIVGNHLNGTLQLTVTAPLINTADIPIDLPLKKPVEGKELKVEAEWPEATKQLQVPIISLHLLGGVLTAQGGLTYGEPVQSFTSNLVFKDIQLEPLMDTLGVEKVTIHGAAANDLTAQGKVGKDVHFADTLEGTGHLTIKDGKIDGINLVRDVAGVLKALGVKPDTNNVTAFSLITSDYSVKNRLITMEKLKIDSQDLQATATGTVGFDQTLNLKAVISLSEELSHAIGGTSALSKFMTTNGRLSVPLLITGTVKAPAYAIDIKGLVGEKIKETIKGKVREILKNKDADDIIDKGQDALQNILNP